MEKSEACSDWKIDPKDPKICRNCKKPKTEHIFNRSSPAPSSLIKK